MAHVEKEVTVTVGIYLLKGKEHQFGRYRNTWHW